MRTIIPGPPGTGKTYKLINTYLNQEIKNGVNPSKMVYITFSKAATTEAEKRIEEKFPAVNLLYISTMHSMGARELKIDTKKYLLEGRKWKSFKNYSLICRDMSFETRTGPNGIPQYQNNHMKIIDYSRSKKLSIQEAAIELDLHEYLDLWLTEQIHKDLETYKEGTGMIEYSDMIKKFIEKDKCPNLEVVFLDEAQDLSPLQWDMFFYIESRCKRSYIAGDDDQTIYTFQGADPSIFINLKGNKDPLIKSRRVPRLIHEKAVSILNNIQNRMEKKWEPRDEEGRIVENCHLEDIDFSKGRWMILTRTNKMLEPISEHLYSLNFRFDSKVNNLLPPDLLEAYRIWERLNNGATVSGKEAEKVYEYLNYNKGHVKHGFSSGNSLVDINSVDIDRLKLDHGLLVTGSWEQLHIPEESKIYIKGLLRDGDDLTKDARIKLSTIHGVKGEECDNVVLFTDIENIIYESANKDPDTEHRIFFVGVTRAKETLYIMEPTSDYQYNIGDPIL
tara:strand:- start:21 stop:1535 length:1515 start_codon:yes stop_codon:yes gene_type:complete